MLRWPGGKWKLREQYEKLLPAAADVTGAYRELAVGGGAVFFAFYGEHRPAILSDINGHLVELYTCLRDDVEGVVSALREHQDAFREAAEKGNAARLDALAGGRSKAEAVTARNAPYDAVFYEVRRRFNTPDLTRLERAAHMLTLSKTCNNGLWRVNKSGLFNTSAGKQYGTDKSGPLHCPTILDEKNLRAVSSALQGAELVAEDMVSQLDRAERGDFVFIDPPYVPIDETANFTSYTAGGFSDADQVRLAEGVRRAERRGVKVAVANSDTPRTRELYQGLDIQVVHAARSINRDGDGRGLVPEILVRTWTK